MSRSETGEPPEERSEETVEEGTADAAEEIAIGEEEKLLSWHNNLLLSMAGRTREMVGRVIQPKTEGAVRELNRAPAHSSRVGTEQLWCRKWLRERESL